MENLRAPVQMNMEAWPTWYLSNRLAYTIKRRMVGLGRFGGVKHNLAVNEGKGDRTLDYPNEGGDNSSGFTGIPCGQGMNIHRQGTDGYWWFRPGGSFTLANCLLTELRNQANSKTRRGLSIRCIKTKGLLTSRLRSAKSLITETPRQVGGSFVAPK